MADSKQFKLVNRLVDLTNKGEINWTPAGDDQTFVATLGQYGVVISRDSAWSESGVMLRLLDSEGESIDEIRAKDFTDIAEQVFAAESLQELFNGARRRAKGADKIIEGILAELDKREKVR